MKPIKIIVTGTDACVTEKPVITSGTVGLPVKFTFDEVWEGLSKTAVFRAGSRSYPVSCEQNAAAVPWEVLEKPGIGLYIGVFGTDTTGAVRIPTVWVLVDTVRQGTTVPDATPTEATPSVYDQIIAAANEAVEVANSVREDADAGKFNIVGQKAPNGGEIFNDYKNNIAISPNAHAEGQETLAGVKGFNIAEVDADALMITVNDKDFENKASASYSVGDFLQFDASQHHYNKLKIVSLSTNDNGQSVIGVKNLTATDLDLTLDSDPNENYVWVIGKNFGEIFPMAYAPHAEGESTIAMGRAAHAEGRQTQAIGGYAHAEGRKTVALYAAHAEGLQTNATGYYSHAEGHKTNAKGEYSHAEGREANATGTASHAEGMETAASGNHAHAEGNSTKAIGLDSHSEGRGTKAIGDHSHAEGLNIEALGIAAHAEGYMTTAKGSCSHAEGANNTADGNNSHAEGEGTNAIGESSHAEGKHTTAIGKHSHASGYHTVASADFQTVVGIANVEDANALFIVGNGEMSIGGEIIHRSNAYTVNKDGTITAGADPVNPMDLVTKRYLEDAVGVAIAELTARVADLEAMIKK